MLEKFKFALGGNAMESSTASGKNLQVCAGLAGATSYLVCSAISGPAPCVELVFFRAQGRADLGQINDGGRVLPCTGKRTRRSLTVLVLSSRHDTDVRLRHSATA